MNKIYFAFKQNRRKIYRASNDIEQDDVAVREVPLRQLQRRRG